MEKVLDDIWLAPLVFWENTDFSNPGFWLHLLLPLLGVWGLAWLLLRFQKSDKLGRKFTIEKSVFLAAYGIATVLIAGYCINWSNGFYQVDRFELADLFALSLCLLIGSMSLMSLSKNYQRSNHQNLIGQPLSRSEEEDQLLAAKGKFEQLKKYLIVPLFAFSLLWVFSNKKYQLVSFVLDTSSSMGVESDQGEIPLETGKRALRKTVLELNDFTDVIITTFQNGDRKNNIDAIINSSESSLKGYNSFYYGEEKTAMINYIGTIGEDEEDLSDYSPVCEVVWKNFLFSQKQGEERNYETISSVLMTDGGDNKIVELDGFFCDHPAYSDFFGTNVNIINLNFYSSDDLPFMAKAEECGYGIEMGYDALTFNAALDHILGDFKRNWSFIGWLVIICLVFMFGSFFINVKPFL